MTISTSSSLHATTVSWQESSPSPSLVVELAGSFSNWSPLPMTRSDEGIWTAVVDLECGRHEYKVIVDGDWRVDESVEKVYNGMGSWNNVLHVEEDKDEDVEENDVEEDNDEEVQETDVEVNKDEEVEGSDVEVNKDEEVQGTDVEESRSEELNETAKEETNAIVSDVDEEITTEVADITTESEDEDERESGPDPNLVMKRAVVMMQKLREVECAVQNLVLTSPVRVTRGKFKKFVKENNSTPAVC